MVTGASNVSNAMAYGKQAAQNIDRAADGSASAGRSSSRRSNTEHESPENSEREPAGMAGHELRGRRAGEIRKEEVVTRLERPEAADEACRCLRCDVKVEA